MAKSPGKETAAPKGGMLRQIAERAGCSVPTVSRVLNGYKTGFSVKPEVAARIHAAVKEFNYAPNPFLRSIRAKNSNVIAIFDPVSNRFGLLKDAKIGFLDGIAGTGYFDVTKYVSLYQAESYRLPLVPAGALLFDISDPDFLQFMEESRIPYVVINGICRESGCSILPDEAGNMKMVIAELFRLGHRRIVFYSNHPDFGELTMHYSGRIRLDAFQRELAARKCDGPPRQLYETGDAGTFIEKAVVSFGATAVVCNDHGCAMNLVLTGGMLARIRARELSVVSMSDDFPLECGDTRIAAVTLDGVDVGKRAARILLERIEQRKSSDSVQKQLVLAGKLLPRDSLFPAARE